MVSPNAKEQEQLSWDELIALVDQRVQLGDSKKVAIKEVAQANNVSKNELYDRYHQK